MYDLVLITQFNDLNNIENLINSIDKNNSLLIAIILVNQMSKEINLTEMCVNSNNDYFYLNLFEKVSLSKSRNLAIKFIKEKKIYFRHIMFPDDDAYFNESFFINYKKNVIEDKNYAINVYDDKENIWLSHFKSKDVLVGSKIKHIMSINMLVYSENLVKFDEKLGVGAEFGSSEDTDFYIRTSKNKPFYILHELIICHPAGQNKHVKMNMNRLFKRLRLYSRGYMYTLVKHGYGKSALLSAGKALISVFYYFMILKPKVSIVYFLVFFVRLYDFIYFSLNKNLTVEI